MSDKLLKMGSLVTVGNMVDGYRYLGLVVDQVAGKQWADRDPTIEYMPNENDKGKFVLIRVLGLKISEGFLHRTKLPPEEPSRNEVVRWSFAQISHARHIAGPDIPSIETFLQYCTICGSLGMKGALFLHEVSLLIEYLRGSVRSRDAMSYYDSKFLAMLGEVLPR